MWFTDNPWPPIVIFGMLAVVFVAMWSSKKRAFFLVLAGAMSLLAVGTFFAEQYILTTEEQVEAEVYRLTDSFEQLDIPVTLEFYSARATKQRNNIKQAGALIDEINSLRITDVSVELLMENSRARTHFRANGTVTGSLLGQSLSQNFSTRWLLTWQREEDEWKVIETQRLHPITGEEIQTFSVE